jgi:hypothetical protein
VEELCEKGAKKYLFSCYKLTSKRAKNVVAFAQQFVNWLMKEKILLKVRESS